MSKYDEVLKPFVSLMERELHANSGKGDRPGWLSMSAYDCMLEIYYHAAKLQKAIKNGDGDGIAEYSADVANMAMMVADICGAIHLAAPVVERQPAAWVHPAYLNQPKDGFQLAIDATLSQISPMQIPLYAEQPAPVAVVNERYEFEKYYDPEALERDSDEYVRMAVQMAWEGWHRRACLDKLKELDQ